MKSKYVITTFCIMLALTGLAYALSGKNASKESLLSSTFSTLSGSNYTSTTSLSSTSITSTGDSSVSSGTSTLTSTSSGSGNSISDDSPDDSSSGGSSGTTTATEDSSNSSSGGSGTNTSTTTASPSLTTGTTNYTTVSPSVTTSGTTSTTTSTSATTNTVSTTTRETTSDTTTLPNTTTTAPVVSPVPATATNSPSITTPSLPNTIAPKTVTTPKITTTAPPRASSTPTATTITPASLPVIMKKNIQIRSDIPEDKDKRDNFEDMLKIAEKAQNSIEDAKEKLKEVVLSETKKDIPSQDLNSVETLKLEQEFDEKISDSLSGIGVSAIDLSKLETEITADLGKDSVIAVKDAIATLTAELETHSEEFVKESGDLLYKDSNQDGISDYDSIYVYDLDPNKPSPVTLHEGKKLTAGEKVLLGLDPKTAEAVKVTPEEPIASSAPVSPVYKVSDVKLNPDKKMSFKGTALPNSFVTIYIYSTPIMVTLKTDSNGEWRYTLDRELEDGEHRIYVATVNNAGKIVAKSSDSIFIKSAQAATLADAPFGTITESPESPEIVDSGNLYWIMAGFFALLAVALFLVGKTSKKNIKEISVNNDASQISSEKLEI